MKNLADLLKKLAEKSATDVNTEEFKALLEATSKLELPENTDLLSGYLLKGDAKNDPEIKNHYFAQFADGFDKTVFKSFGELGIDQSILDEIKKTEPSSFKRIESLTLKAKEHIAKIADPSTLKGEKAEIQKKLEKIEGEMKSLIEIHDNEKRQLVELRENDLIDYDLEREARSFKLIDIPYQDVISKQSIKKSLEEHGVKLVRKEGRTTLVNATDPTLSPKDGVTLKSIIEKGFANDKLLDLGNSEAAKAAAAQAAVSKTTTVIPNEKQSTLAKNAEAARAMMSAAE